MYNYKTAYEVVKSIEVVELVKVSESSIDAVSRRSVEITMRLQRRSIELCSVVFAQYTVDRSNTVNIHTVRPNKTFKIRRVYTLSNVEEVSIV